MPMNTSQMIFVFGSNLQGLHGAGAALFAKNYRGAEYRVGYGPTGQSFAIPTVDFSGGARNRVSLRPYQIEPYINGFMVFAKTRPDLPFQVTCIGCGLAHLRHADIAPMFRDAPDNCFFDTLWKPWLDHHQKYWGTF